MAAVMLPPKLTRSLDDLAGRVREIRSYRAIGRAAFLLPTAALLAVAADGYFQLPGTVRTGLLIGWIVLLIREVWNIRRARNGHIDYEAIASAVEAEYPRLAERLTTAVELAEHSDLSNGSPALIEEVIQDADTRARKLELEAAFPRTGSLFAFIIGMAVLGVVLGPALMSPRSRELSRRFFLPWYTPSKVVHYKVAVTSGDPAVKRGDPVTLTAVVEAIKPGAELPASATLVAIENGVESRYPMASDEANVWHYTRSIAIADFDYRVEAGDAVSATHQVIVVEPITVAAAKVTIKPPAYAARMGEADPAVEGLGEINALEHSTLTFDIRFHPRQGSASLEFTPQAEEGKPVNKERLNLTVGPNGTVQHTMVARTSGTVTLAVVGDHNLRSEFPAQPLRVAKDEPPKIPTVSGLSDKPRKVRPSERMVVECAATDDVALTKLALEWKVNDGKVQTIPLEAHGLGTGQADGKATLSLKDKVKNGDKFACRIVAVDNRDFPGADLAPQTTYYPAKDWSEYVVDAAADPLGEQQIRGQQKAIEKKLQEIRDEVREERAGSDTFRRGTEKTPTLSEDEREKLKGLMGKVAESTAKLDELAAETKVTPELAAMADEMRRVSDGAMRDAQAALGQGRDSSNRDERTNQFKKATESLANALKAIEDLLKENDRIAQERLDKWKLAELARDQKDLADQAKKADPKEAAELAKRQKELEERLEQLRKESEAVQKALQAAQSDWAQALAEQAKKLAEEMARLNRAMQEAEKNSTAERIAEMKKRQEQLAKRARELADKTDTASRVSETRPLKTDDLDKAKQALDEGRLDEAAKDQEKFRQELERLARDLANAAAQTRNSREAARQLSRLQKELKDELARETKNTPLDKVPEAKRKAMEAQQEAIQKAADGLRVPPGDSAASKAKKQAVDDARDAADLLKRGASAGAEQKMQEAKESLDALAGKLPSPEQRLARAKEEVAKLKKQQEAIRDQAEAAAKMQDGQDPDNVSVQREIARRLSESAKRQAEMAEQVKNLDAPGQEARQDRAAAALQKAAADLTSGRPQDTSASQQAARREFDRLEQALSGQTPADEKLRDLAARQRHLAQEAEKSAREPDKSLQQDLAKAQGEIARELEKVQTPEAATAQSEAVEAARAAEKAAPKPDELAKKAKAAAEKVEQWNERVQAGERAAEAARRLAQRQQANAENQERQRTQPSTGEARRQAGRELDELKNMRPGADAQKAKQEATEALQRASNALDPAANAKAQKEAAEALNRLADKLERDAKAQEKPPADPAEAAEQLAKKQRQLAQETKEAMEKARQGGDQAKKDALDQAAAKQRDLNRQAAEMPGSDSPRDQQAAQEAMHKAEEQLQRGNAESAMQKQREAADALDQLNRQAKANRDAKAAAQHPDMPNAKQAAEAKQLAEEQRKLRDEAMKAADDLAKENARQDNPIGDLTRQQQELAKQAEELAKTVSERQGPNAESAKQSQQAAQAARSASDKLQNGQLDEAKQAGQSAEKAMTQAGQDKGAGDSGQKARDLARQQADVNQKLDQLSRDGSAARAQQAARQDQLGQQARELGDKLDETGKQLGEKAQDAARMARQSGDQMAGARQASRRGQPDQAGSKRQQAAESMAEAARRADEAAKQSNGASSGGSPQAGQAMQRAQGQMGEAQRRLGQQQPGEAGRSMDQSAQSLAQAAQQLGQGNGQGDGRPNQGQGGNNPGGNIGGPGGKLDLRQFSPDVAKHTGKGWGELPGEIKTKVIQEMKARYGEDYARNIKLYFEQLAERK